MAYTIEFENGRVRDVDVRRNEIPECGDVECRRHGHGRVTCPMAADGEVRFTIIDESGNEEQVVSVDSETADLDLFGQDDGEIE